MTERLTERASRARVRLAGPAGLVAAIPYLLGFHPTESVVVVGLRHGGEEVCLTARLDLAAPELDGVVAERLAEPIRGAGASRAVVVLIHEDGGAGEYGECVGEDGGNPLPRRWLVEQLREALRGRGVELDDALLVRDGRWWSYLCPDPRCCPSSGRVVAPEVDGVLAAETALRGTVVLPDRAALEQVLQGAPVPDEARRAEAFQRAGRALADAVGRSGSESVVRDGALTVLAVVRARVEAQVPLSDAEVARLCLLLATPAVRDLVLVDLVDGTGWAGAAEALWLELVRRAQPGWAAAPATLLGLQSYLRGDGAFARVCLQRALDEDPDHPLALLLSAALDRAVPPEVVGRLAREAGRGGDHPGPVPVSPPVTEAHG